MFKSPVLLVCGDRSIVFDNKMDRDPLQTTGGVFANEIKSWNGYKRFQKKVSCKNVSKMSSSEKIIQTLHKQQSNIFKVDSGLEIPTSDWKGEEVVKIQKDSASRLVNVAYSAKEFGIEFEAFHSDSKHCYIDVTITVYNPTAIINGEKVAKDSIKKVISIPLPRSVSHKVNKLLESEKLSKENKELSDNVFDVLAYIVVDFVRQYPSTVFADHEFVITLPSNNKLSLQQVMCCAFTFGIEDVMNMQKVYSTERVSGNVWKKNELREQNIKQREYIVDGIRTSIENVLSKHSKELELKTRLLHGNGKSKNTTSEIKSGRDMLYDMADEWKLNGKCNVYNIMAETVREAYNLMYSISCLGMYATTLKENANYSERFIFPPSDKANNSYLEKHFFGTEAYFNQMLELVATEYSSDTKKIYSSLSSGSVNALLSEYESNADKVLTILYRDNLVPYITSAEKLVKKTDSTIDYLSMIQKCIDLLTVKLSSLMSKQADVLHEIRNCKREDVEACKIYHPTTFSSAASKLNQKCVELAYELSEAKTISSFSAVVCDSSINSDDVEALNSLEPQEIQNLIFNSVGLELPKLTQKTHFTTVPRTLPEFDFPSYYDRSTNQDASNISASSSKNKENLFDLLQTCYKNSLIVPSNRFVIFE